MKGISSKNNKIYVSSMGVFFIFLISIAEIYEVGYFNMYYLTCPLISLFWGVMGVAVYFNDRKKCGRYSLRRQSVIYGLRIMIIPWVVFFFHNVIIFILGNGEREFLKSSFVQITFVPIFIIGACGMYYLMGKNTIRYIVYAIYLNYIFVIYAGIRKYGLIGSFKGIMTVFQGNSVYNPLELNGDVVFTLGLFLIFYYESYRIKDKANVGHISLLIIFVVLGGKKVEYLGLVIISIILLCIKKIKDKKLLRKIINSTAICSVLILLCYVSFIVSGALETWTIAHGINTMNRVKWYALVSKYAVLSPVFMGKGYSFCNLKLEELGYNVALHSDILKIYIEMGFTVFVFWVIYNLGYAPVKILRKYGMRTARFFWISTLYLFMNYVTDNSTNYFTVQTVYVLLTIYLIEKAREPTDCCNDTNK